MAKVTVYAAQRHLEYEGDELIDIKGLLEEAQTSAQSFHGDKEELDWYEDSEDTWRAITIFFEYSVTRYEVEVPTAGEESEG